MPLLDCTHVGLATEKSWVIHTPRSVPIITSLASKGLARIERTGISGRSPSLADHVDPPSLV